MRGHPRDVAVTAGLGVLAFAVAVGSLSALAGHDADDRSKPLIAEPGPSRRAVTAPGPSPVASDSGQAAPLAPSSAASPPPTPVRTGSWAGVATLTVTGSEMGCRATTKTFRRAATLRIGPPLPGEDNAVHLALRTEQQSTEGSFGVVSAVAGPPRVVYWTLSGDGSGGLLGTLSAPAADPVRDKPAVDNVLYARRGLDQQCGSLLAAPLSFPMASGAALRTRLAGPHARVQLTGRTSDRTRTFEIAFTS
jgi:hypothetical protein